MSYYQDVKDPNIPVDDVKNRLDNICEILDTNPPETIIYDESWGSFQRPRLLDNGRTIILYKSPEDSILNWQICNLYHSLATRKSSQWMIRHFDTVMLLLIFFDIAICVALLFFAAGVLSISVAFAFLLAQIPYVGAAWIWRKAGQDKMLLWKETMNRAGLWPDGLGSKFQNVFRMMLWSPFGLVIIVVYQILMYSV